MAEDCPPLVAVVFPAMVTSETLSLTRSKVFLAADRVWFAVDTPSGPTVVQDFLLSGIALLGNDSYELTTTDGVVLQVRQGGGCGCGSRLRSWTPFSGPLRVGT